MTDAETTPEQPKYILFEFERGHFSILRSNSDHTNQKNTYSTHMRDVGSYSNAMLILDALAREEAKRKESNRRADEEWEKRLKAPHAYISPSTRSLVCYCGKTREDEIHISEEEESRRADL